VNARETSISKYIVIAIEISIASLRRHRRFIEQLVALARRGNGD
jgi:hypothetical protein